MIKIIRNFWPQNNELLGLLLGPVWTSACTITHFISLDIHGLCHSNWQIRLPKVCELIFKLNTHTHTHTHTCEDRARILIEFSNYLKFVSWYSSWTRSRSLISLNFSFSSCVTVPTPSDLGWKINHFDSSAFGDLKIKVIFTEIQQEVDLCRLLCSSSHAAPPCLRLIGSKTNLVRFEHADRNFG